MSVRDALESIPEDLRHLVRARRQPTWTPPMLATLTGDHFSDPDWIYERKLDGVRCLVFRTPKQVRLVSRNRNALNGAYPELVDLLEDQPAGRFVADGEIVAFSGKVTSFSRLQQRIGIRDPDRARRSGVAVHLYLFDLLHVDGRDLTRLPVRQRKRLLKSAVRFHGRLRYTPHRNEHGERYLQEACRRRWEGLIAKRADSAYAHSRSRDWLKFKCVNRQELVIGGYTDPKGSRIGFGALLVGHYENGTLRYAGKVGTGYDDETLESLGARLSRLERETSPFAPAPKVSGSHWVRPTLVAEVGFTEWTSDGKLRHPTFVGLRGDKRPKDVRRERRS